jgi:glycosyltransferase involved in cell wall biosynthesis
VEYEYVTADAIGTATGGGAVTKHESIALQMFGAPVGVNVGGSVGVNSYSDAARPWGPDDSALDYFERQVRDGRGPKLAHFYSGTFTKTIELLRAHGCRVTYTAAAHDIRVSREEHEKLGLAFDYPHLTDPDQWARYLRGYLLADVVICPSAYSADIMKSYGCKRVRVIPHGIVPSSKPIAPLPRRFVAASLGQPGPDKGLIYLLQAWASLAYSDALLIISGRGTEALLPLVRMMNRGNAFLLGEVDDVSDVYDACALFVQPSASEGFGIEVIEALAHGRPVICSSGAGAWRAATYSVSARDASALAKMIDDCRTTFLSQRNDYPSDSCQLLSRDYHWDNIYQKYIDVWLELLR